MSVVGVDRQGTLKDGRSFLWLRIVDLGSSLSNSRWASDGLLTSVGQSTAIRIQRIFIPRLFVASSGPADLGACSKAQLQEPPVRGRRMCHRPANCSSNPMPRINCLWGRIRRRARAVRIFPLWVLDGQQSTGRGLILGTWGSYGEGPDRAVFGAATRISDAVRILPLSLPIRQAGSAEQKHSAFLVFPHPLLPCTCSRTSPCGRTTLALGLPTRASSCRC